MTIESLLQIVDLLSSLEPHAVSFSWQFYISLSRIPSMSTIFSLEVIDLSIHMITYAFSGSFDCVVFF